MTRKLIKTLEGDLREDLLRNKPKYLRLDSSNIDYAEYKIGESEYRLLCPERMLARAVVKSSREDTELEVLKRTKLTLQRGLTHEASEDSSFVSGLIASVAVLGEVFDSGDMKPLNEYEIQIVVHNDATIDLIGGLEKEQVIYSLDVPLFLTYLIKGIKDFGFDKYTTRPDDGLLAMLANREAAVDIYSHASGNSLITGAVDFSSKEDEVFYQFGDCLGVSYSSLEKMILSKWPDIGLDKDITPATLVEAADLVFAETTVFFDLTAARHTSVDEVIETKIAQNNDEYILIASNAAYLRWELYLDVDYIISGVNRLRGVVGGINLKGIQ